MAQGTAKIGLDDDDETVSQVEDADIESLDPRQTRAIDKVDTKKVVERPYTPDLWDKARKNLKAAMGNKKGGMIKSSASKRADGCAQRGKTKGRMV